MAQVCAISKQQIEYAERRAGYRDEGSRVCDGAPDVAAAIHRADIVGAHASCSHAIRPEAAARGCGDSRTVGVLERAHAFVIAGPPGSDVTGIDRLWIAPRAGFEKACNRLSLTASRLVDYVPDLVVGNDLVAQLSQRFDRSEAPVNDRDFHFGSSCTRATRNLPEVIRTMNT